MQARRCPATVFGARHRQPEHLRQASGSPSVEVYRVGARCAARPRAGCPFLGPLPKGPRRPCYLRTFRTLSAAAAHGWAWSRGPAGAGRRHGHPDCRRSGDVRRARRACRDVAGEPAPARSHPRLLAGQPRLGSDHRHGVPARRRRHAARRAGAGRQGDRGSHQGLHRLQGERVVRRDVEGAGGRGGAQGRPDELRRHQRPQARARARRTAERRVRVRSAPRHRQARLQQRLRSVLRHDRAGPVGRCPAAGRRLPAQAALLAGLLPAVRDRRQDV